MLTSIEKRKASYGISHAIDSYLEAEKKQQYCYEMAHNTSFFKEWEEKGDNYDIEMELAVKSISRQLENINIKIHPIDLICIYSEDKKKAYDIMESL